MSTTTAADPVEAIFEALARPFDPSDVKHRSQGGRQLSYITPRTARRRLNEVLGAHGWENKVVPGDRWVKCSLTLHLPNGLSLTREALGGYPNMPSEEDGVKGGDSDAFKRAAALFGVGEYLYGDDTAFVDRLEAAGAVPGVKRGSDLPPARDEAPRNGHGHDHDRPREAPRGGPGGGGGLGLGSPPRSGKALFAWLKDAQAKTGLQLIDHVNRWAKHHRLPDRMVDFDDGAVADAVAEVMRKLDSQDAGAHG